MEITDPLPFDRVRRHTSGQILACIDKATSQNLRHAARTNDIDGALARVDAEWDTDRTIELEAATVGLLGLALGLRHAGFLLVPAAVGASVLLHAVTGWYPLLPLFRKAGVRSAREIERERYALKAIRGDFEDLSRTSPQESGVMRTAH
jgi:hypothetical protein